MKSSAIMVIAFMIGAVLLSPEFGRCELKSLDDAELSKVEAAGVLISNNDNPKDSTAPSNSADNNRNDSINTMDTDDCIIDLPGVSCNPMAVRYQNPTSSCCSLRNR